MRGVWRVDDLPCFLWLADYKYDKLEKGEHYVPPNKNHSGDVRCDCNTVVYR